MKITSLEISEIANEATKRIQDRWNTAPRFAIVLGTGSGQLAQSIQMEAHIPYADLPGFPTSTALGHAGQFVCGRLAGQPVIAMQGRFHIYEGYSRDHSAIGIHVLARLGAKFLLLSNAAGGINPKFRSGEIMLITSQIDLLFRKSKWNASNALGRPAQRSDSVYDRELIEQAEACARRHNFVTHRGSYCGLLGPNYETRAEYRFLRKVGGDTVGMSTIPEVCVATHYGLRTLGISIVTNVAKPDSLDPTSGQEVIDAASVAAPNLKLLFENAVQANSR